MASKGSVEKAWMIQEDPSSYIKWVVFDWKFKCQGERIILSLAR